MNRISGAVSGAVRIFQRILKLIRLPHSNTEGCKVVYKITLCMNNDCHATSFVEIARTVGKGDLCTAITWEIMKKIAQVP